MKQVIKKVKENNERGARQNLIEDLFYDFNRSKAEVYKMNFIRGIFFGLGSVLGGTVLLAVAVWLLGFFVHIPGIGHTLQEVQRNIQTENKK